MIELHIRPMSTDEEGYTEVCLVTQSMEESDGSFHENQDGEASDGETVGYVRIVEGTEEGPHTWWDARVHDEDGAEHHRRFTSLPAALLAMAMRMHLDTDSRRILGW